MRIFDQDSVNIQKPQSGRTTEISGGKSRTAAKAFSAVGEDRVDVSSQNHLQALVAAVSEESRAGRVEELRSLFQSGNYQVDYSALSKAIVTGMQYGG